MTTTRIRIETALARIGLFIHAHRRDLIVTTVALGFFGAIVGWWQNYCDGELPVGPTEGTDTSGDG